MTFVKGSFLYERGAEAVCWATHGASGVMEAGGAVFAPLAWSLMGVIYIAETTYNYSQLKKGKISKEEFKKR